ncbi:MULTISPECIES: pseudouridine synthase [Enterococcaceae]|uniref:pseudouridine synthase n=1 Tax=Enterococcaceae TaxID=81852 RepID=UPI000E485E42|nr:MULTISPECIES: pseudouridine synthase [Enterococcaceae]MCI0131357.1 rRNA pseudouridine synthase [Vagococcus sp. CY53-2]RGI29088.1 rRNA pseudouridine synthase [Melissococcus sp. OM08-11BH]UNM89589.1 rRNA pseudouridine synthase [Vagococcus sp. CY52-2]
MRLDKFLSHTGFGSRKEVKELLKKKRVTVNQTMVRDAKFSVNENEDEVCVDGQPVLYEKYVYYMLNKPKGVISATEDASSRTVIDLVKVDDYKKGLFPVGRLDKDTTGLLLLTNDGALAHELLSPKKKVPKLYQALVQGKMTDEDIDVFSKGVIRLDGDECLPAKLTILSVDEKKEQSIIQLEIMEGKYHQVKRMVGAVGKKVIELERLEMANLILDTELLRGKYRPLTENELKLLKNNE